MKILNYSPSIRHVEMWLGLCNYNIVGDPGQVKALHYSLISFVQKEFLKMRSGNVDACLISEMKGPAYICTPTTLWCTTHGLLWRLMTLWNLTVTLYLESLVWYSAYCQLTTNCWVKIQQIFRLYTWIKSSLKMVQRCIRIRVRDQRSQ